MTHKSGRLKRWLTVVAAWALFGFAFVVGSACILISEGRFP